MIYYMLLDWHKINKINKFNIGVWSCCLMISIRVSASQFNDIANYNHGHNIVRIFDVFPNFPFAKSETKPDY